MILNIRVIPKSSRALVQETASALKVYLTKPAENNLANLELVNLLAEHFRVKKYQIKIIKGHKSRNKVIEIADVE